MIVNKIEPQGYCGGVTRALKMANEAILNEDLEKPIYMLGEIIHNSFVINDLENKGIITIDCKNKSRLELLDSIDKGTVIFSAHGVSPLVYKKAKDKGLNIIDASCPYVLMVHKKIIEHIEKGYDIIYIGTNNHPECEGVLGISSSIHFINNKEDLYNLNIKNDKIYATNQTTLSMFDTLDIFNEIKQLYPFAIIDDKICNATTERQNAMKNQPKCELCIVVGDKKSSNTKKLVKVSQELGIKTIFCEDLDSLDKSELTNVNIINISSGASTPSYIVDNIIEYLKSK